MNQFIPYFLGQAEPPYPRAVTVAEGASAPTTSRTSATTDRHLTFFEMLGNFSFGDYFKAEALRVGARAGHRGLRDRPRPPVGHGVRDDEEAVGIWRRPAGIPPERIVASRQGDDELLADARGRPRRPVLGDLRRPRVRATAPRAAPTSTRSASWRSGTSSSCRTRSTATARSLGDAAGEEHRHRLVARARRDGPAGRRATSSRPTCSPRCSRRSQSLSGKRLRRATTATTSSLKIVAEHGRATTFLIADGVQPSNEGRGYILRRMLRRVVSHARRLGDRAARDASRSSTSWSTASATPTPSSVRTRPSSRQVADSEEERFSATLRQGTGAVRGRARDRARRRRGRGRRRVQAVRHVRVPDAS